MATVQTFEIMPDQFNVDRMYLTNSYTQKKKKTATATISIIICIYICIQLNILVRLGFNPLTLCLSPKLQTMS